MTVSIALAALAVFTLLGTTLWARHHDDLHKGDTLDAALTWAPNPCWLATQPDFTPQELPRVVVQDGRYIWRVDTDPEKTTDRWAPGPVPGTLTVRFEGRRGEARFTARGSTVDLVATTWDGDSTPQGCAAI